MKICLRCMKPYKNTEIGQWFCGKCRREIDIESEQEFRKQQASVKKELRDRRSFAEKSETRAEKSDDDLYWERVGNVWPPKR
jgi:uncharacterized Zn finger protein (UPF0148 family)